MAAVAECLTQTEAAKRLRISTAWVRELTNRGMLSRNPDGSYPWPEIADEYESLRDDDDAEVDELEQERIRWTRAKADHQEQENAVRRGELVPAESVEDMVRLPLEAVDQVLRSAKRRLGRKWAKRMGVTVAEAANLIDDIVEDVRSDLRRVLEEDAAA